MSVKDFFKVTSPERPCTAPSGEATKLLAVLAEEISSFIQLDWQMISWRKKDTFLLAASC